MGNPEPSFGETKVETGEAKVSTAKWARSWQVGSPGPVWWVEKVTPTDTLSLHAYRGDDILLAAHLHPCAPHNDSDTSASAL